MIRAHAATTLECKQRMAYRKHTHTQNELGFIRLKSNDYVRNAKTPPADEPPPGESESNERRGPTKHTPQPRRTQKNRPPKQNKQPPKQKHQSKRTTPTPNRATSEGHFAPLHRPYCYNQDTNLELVPFSYSRTGKTATTCSYADREPIPVSKPGYPGSW